MDPIVLEIVQEGLISIVKEMRANLTRTAYSSVIYEARDFSCVILDPKGQLVAQAEDNPSHVFPIPWSVQTMFEKFQDDINAGDIFLHNDPYTGGTHLNDIALIYPIFIDEALYLFPVIRAHWGDVGGATSGSLSGGSTEIFQEGVRIPVLKVYQNGQPNQAVLDLLFNNMRIPFEREGDFESILGTCRTAENRIRELASKHGASVVGECVEIALDLSEQRMRRAISRISQGDYFYETYLDGTVDSLEPVMVKVKITVEKDCLTIDFTGSSPQTKGPLNAGPAVAPSGAFIVLKSFLDPDSAMNHGAFRPIRIINPVGSVLNARYPAACGGFSEIRRCVESAIMGALAKAIPDEITGDIKGTANHVYISGTDPLSGAPFIFYEYPAGGTGAFNGSDGNNAVRSFTEGDFSSIQPIESIENQFPLMVERCELRVDSGGNGKTRGGLGLRRAVRVLAEDAFLNILSDKNIIPPFGVLGGLPGSTNRFSVYRGEKSIDMPGMPGKVAAFPLRKDDVIIMETSGGGGYGDPLKRDFGNLRTDLLNGLVTKKKAEACYGLVFKGEEIDREKTDKLREKIQKERSYLRVFAWDGQEYEGTRRRCLLGFKTIEDLNLYEGDLVELVNDQRAPLRGWICRLAHGEEGAVYLGKIGMEILGIGKGALVEIRPVRVRNIKT